MATRWIAFKRTQMLAAGVAFALIGTIIAVPLPAGDPPTPATPSPTPAAPRVPQGQPAPLLIVLALPPAGAPQRLIRDAVASVRVTVPPRAPPTPKPPERACMLIVPPVWLCSASEPEPE